MTLLEFLNARLDEDEAAAKAASDTSGHTTWLSVGIEAGPDDDKRWAEIADRAWGVVAPHPDPPDDDTFYELGGDLLRQRGRRGMAEHVARHDPARVLREVAAKRAVIGSTAGELERYGNMPPEVHAMAEEVVKALAAVYSDHPDYQQEWKP